MTSTPTDVVSRIVPSQHTINARTTIPRRLSHKHRLTRLARLGGLGLGALQWKDKMSDMFAEPLVQDRRAQEPDSRVDAHQSLRRVAAPRALGATPAYWFSMFAASALGTNLGDFTVETLSLGRGMSFALLAVITGLAFWGDSRFARRSDAGYWIAIVTLRAAATNVGDFLTEDLSILYPVLIVVLGLATLFAGCFTRIGEVTSTSPLIDRRYWTAMLIAGIFGTVGGDFISHAIGLYAAAAVLCTAAVIVLAARSAFAATSVLTYWSAVLVERCAGTPVGDALASHRAVGLGLKWAMVCTGGMLLIGLLLRSRERRRDR
jgi:uncharacterized membrane-anchored protein